MKLRPAISSPRPTRSRVIKAFVELYRVVRREFEPFYSSVRTVPVADASENLRTLDRSLPIGLAGPVYPGELEEGP